MPVLDTIRCNSKGRPARTHQPWLGHHQRKLGGCSSGIPPLVLPVCSGIALLLRLGSVSGVTYAGSSAQPLNELAASVDRVSYGSGLVYVALFYFATSFTAIFFNAALVSCAWDAFAGRTPTVRGGRAAALRRLPQIFAWALVAATVGLVLNIVQACYGRSSALSARCSAG